jgi:hypothetical protein
VSKSWASLSTATGVGQWINLRDIDDFISLNRSLSETLFSGKINNQVFAYPGNDAHATHDYRSHAVVATAVKEV